MATHHSKTGRTKGTNAQIVVPSWDSVWASFEGNNTKTTIGAMNAEGWRTLDQVMEKTGLSSPRIYNMVREGKFESVKRKIFHTGKTRDIKFVRPVV